MSEAVLATYGISKSFGALKASEEISLDLRAGEIHAMPSRSLSPLQQRALPASASIGRPGLGIV